MATKHSEISGEDMRQAAEYARAFANLIPSAERKHAFAQSAAEWDKQADELEAAARLRPLKNER